MQCDVVVHVEKPHYDLVYGLLQSSRYAQRGKVNPRSSTDPVYICIYSNRMLYHVDDYVMEHGITDGQGDTHEIRKSKFASYHLSHSRLKCQYYKLQRVVKIRILYCVVYGQIPNCLWRTSRYIR